ncbi:MAG: hypothetical protein AAF828_13380 [Bacteroidota bacterium]
MNQYKLAKSLVPYLSAYLLLVSLGLPLHKVYCACKGESEVSLLLANEHECRRHDHLNHQVDKVAKASCCSKQLAHTTTNHHSPAKVAHTELQPWEVVPRCCSKVTINERSDKATSTVSCSVHANQDHDCGSTETIVAKLTADYIIDQELELPHYTFVALLPGQVFTHIVDQDALRRKAYPIRGPDPPPIRYGRTLLIHQQLFLC